MSQPTDQITQENSSYQIKRELIQIKHDLDEMLIENFGEIDQRSKHMLQEIDRLEEVAEKKAERIKWFVDSFKELQGVAEGGRKYHYSEYKKYQKAKKKFTRAIDRMKTYVADLLLATGKTSFKTDGKTISLGASYSLDIYDKDKAFKNVPDEFIKVKKSIDKRALKNHLDNSNDISYDGVRINKNNYVRGL